MQWKYKIIFLVLLFFKSLCCNTVIASTISAISIRNYTDQSTITVYSDTVPTYRIFFLHNPERVVLDLFKISKINSNQTPIGFYGHNLIKCIRSSTSIDRQSIRIVCDLNHASYIETLTQQQSKRNYCVILTILKKNISTPSSYSNMSLPYVVERSKLYENINRSAVNNDQKKITKIQFNNQKYMGSSRKRNYFTLPVIVVAIDAGHGGQDPGATGCRNRIYEKDVTLSIAKKFKNFLDFDPMFSPVMIREGDKFLSVVDRSNLARKKKANVLVSIHTDASINSNVKGASVWILSNRRAKTEASYWLKSQEKYSELLGGIGNILIHYRDNPYFNHLVLDLQFCSVQRASYNMAIKVLSQLKNVGVLHKHAPEYSNFGILRSPDIPSILVETGFISNFQEENLLSTDKYQERIAFALYKGLCLYFLEHQQKLIPSLSM